MLSVIIPALDAESSLARCLERLAGSDEIIVVDGGSRDGTAAIAEAAGARLIAAPKGRGVQLRIGAQAASGDWLLFLHADTLLAPGWREAVEAHVARTGKPACFRFRLDDRSWQARLIERGTGLRARMLGLPYGDQGLLVSRVHYGNVGGYRDIPLMEDVDLVRRLGGVRVLPVDAVTSADRWRRDGWFRRSGKNLAFLALYRLGVSPTRLARRYG
jgi:rSAM/selenodomain-associated transferase 2